MSKNEEVNMESRVAKFESLLKSLKSLNIELSPKKLTDLMLEMAPVLLKLGGKSHGVRE